MAVGLVLVSAFLALISATFSLALGGTWLAAIAVYFAVGMATSLALIGRMVLMELRSGAMTNPLTAVRAEKSARLA